MNSDSEFSRAQRLSSVLRLLNSKRKTSISHDSEDTLDELLELPFGLSRPLTYEDVKLELEERYLKPLTTFPTSWLSSCQQYWEREPNYMTLVTLGPSKPRATIEVRRDGIDGEIISYKEVAVPDETLTAKNSTSLLREPGAPKDFVKGGSNYIPFAPGGLESEVLKNEVEEVTEDLEEMLRFEEDGILTIPPGFEHGLIFEDEETPNNNAAVRNAVTGLNIIDMLTHDEDDFKFLETLKKEKITRPKIIKGQPPSIQNLHLLKKSDKNIAAKKRDWAHVVDVNIELSNFKELVPEMAIEYPFELDTFQKQAVYHLEYGDSVFVAAHTSAGKTVVAEYAIALAIKHMTKAIYTSPIKALSNQKYRDFKDRFDSNVGILTGDVQIQPEASCLIMTTEILRSMLYKGADLIRDVEFVIFDEVHYVNDSERGVVWEEVIILLPAHVSIILLSATVHNTKEFADWVGRTKKKDIYVISTTKRPIPLEHYLYANKDIHKIVDAKRRFLTMEASKRCIVKKGQRWGGSFRPMVQQDKHLWSGLTGFLNKKKLFPVIIFTFSKKKCDENAQGLTNVDLCSAIEKSKIHVFIEKSLTRLKGTDKKLPQVIKIRELLSRGIAMVEILFGQGLVKVLFATETFAMGVNMPARTVVFSDIQKYDGKVIRLLSPGEYTQMSGRAGRRGKDPTGMVIIACSGDKAPDSSTLENMILGNPAKLESQFRLTYNMILNLLRVEELKVEEMIKRSFSENTSQKMLPDHQKMFDEREKSLNTFKKLDCTICNRDINQFYDESTRIYNLNHELIQQIVSRPIGVRTLSPGRVVIVNNSFYRNTAAVVLTSMAKSSTFAATNSFISDKRFMVLMLLDTRSKSAIEDMRNIGVAPPPLPVTRVANLDQNSLIYEITDIAPSDIAVITRTTIKITSENILMQDELEITKAIQQLSKCAIELQNAGTIENDWFKIKELGFQENLAEKSKLVKRINKYQCTKCPDLSEHAKRLLKAKVDELRHTISEQNLELLPECEQRVEVLKRLNYIDQNGTVQLKGQIACEINSADQLVLTELILDNTFGEFEPEEIVALLSCFVFQEKHEITENLIPQLEKGKTIILDIVEKIGEVQRECGLPISVDEYLGSFKFGLVEVVYEWARGMSFLEIKDLTDVLEGSIVRCITRLDETCREIRNAARIIGNLSLYKKMDDAQMKIKRDIVFAASL
ncbi:9016_t:CDS:10, partial [Ambispora leptoticha]